eukprot:CAMPEP_0185847000 /NCGR_PEP_ID=MMETSP1354-20130828/2436_1 /TAXON_ID=708628 /ORGANISM="Erythrolobus madagascarensis, Strain CCMP3276" /LENGTH=431 /DNA_ID=CAMNT_0028547235 /DNA_START=415 /DNA_END=1706 /DNA_ORIENTATION=-
MQDSAAVKAKNLSNLIDMIGSSSPFDEPYDPLRAVPSPATHQRSASCESAAKTVHCKSSPTSTTVSSNEHEAVQVMAFNQDEIDADVADVEDDLKADFTRRNLPRAPHLPPENAVTYRRTAFAALTAGVSRSPSTLCGEREQEKEPVPKQAPETHQQQQASNEEEGAQQDSSHATYYGSLTERLKQESSQRRLSGRGPLARIFSRQKDSLNPMMNFHMIMGHLHSSIKAELRDLGRIRRALAKKLKQSQTGVIPMETRVVAEWWDVFEAYSVNYFLLEDQVLLGFLHYQHFVIIMEDKMELTSLYLEASHLVQLVQYDTKKVGVLVETLEYLEKRFMRLLEYEVNHIRSLENGSLFRSYEVQRKVLEFLVDTNQPQLNLVLFVCWMDAKAQREWLGKNVNYRTRREYKQWHAHVRKAHHDHVDLLESCTYP